MTFINIGLGYDVDYRFRAYWYKPDGELVSLWESEEATLPEDFWSCWWFNYGNPLETCSGEWRVRLDIQEDDAQGNPGAWQTVVNKNFDVAFDGTCSSDAECQDGNPCTDNWCDCTCQSSTNAAPCNDGVFCNGADTCSGGSCALHTGDPCAGGAECADSCNEQAGNCFDSPETPCASDSNVCTDDLCNGLGGCRHPDNSASCDDSNACTQTDTCQSGTCNGSNPVVCTPSDQCHDAGTCDPDTGVCSDPPKPDGTPCDDGDPATCSDLCSAGECSGGSCCGDGICDQKVGEDCGNCPGDCACPAGQECVDGICEDICGDDLCTGSENPCTCEVDCSGPNACCIHNDCFDADPCTNELCIDFVCQYEQVPGCCGDGICEWPENCTTCHQDCACEACEQCVDAICQPSCGNGSCETECGEDCNTCSEDCGCDSSGDCNDGNSCTQDLCVDGCCENPPEPAGTPCPDDGNSCTDDECNGSGQCTHPNSPDGTSCDDGDSATCEDHCVAGDCTGDPEACDCSNDCDLAPYTIGGAVYDCCDNPLTCGVEGVEICVECEGGFQDCDISEGGAGLWQISGVPCRTCTISPPLGYCHVVDQTCPPDPCENPIEIEVCDENMPANQSIGLYQACMTYDMNGDGFPSIIGDVPCFVGCVYFNTCDSEGFDACATCPCDDPNLVCRCDCNCDGFCSIIGDVPCFVDCIYFGNCVECAAANEGDGGGPGDDGFTIGGAVFEDRSSPLASGVVGLKVKVVDNRERVVGTTTSGEFGLWKIDGLAEGKYVVIFGNRQHVLQIMVSETNKGANQSITWRVR